MIRFFLLFSIFLSMPLGAIQEGQTNVLLYNDTVQVTTEINDEYANIVAGKPINGSILITHNSKELIDPNGFSLGKMALKAEFLRDVTMSSYSNLVITIYRFQLPGMSPGVHVLDPIQAKVNGKFYQAPPITLQVGH